MSGEGEGSKATLVAWLKRRAEADFGHGVVGRNVWVCWCDPRGCPPKDPIHEVFARAVSFCERSEGSAR